MGEGFDGDELGGYKDTLSGRVPEPQQHRGSLIPIPGPDVPQSPTRAPVGSQLRTAAEEEEQEEEAGSCPRTPTIPAARDRSPLAHAVAARPPTAAAVVALAAKALLAARAAASASSLKSWQEAPLDHVLSS